jgi:hypothetical protein
MLIHKHVFYWICAAMVGVVAATTAVPAEAKYNAPVLRALHLKRQETYRHARQTLMFDGWKPVRSKGDKGGGNADELLQAGFLEVHWCMGTGLNFCTFIWKRAGKCVRVTTAGEYLPTQGAPKVYDAEFGSCSSFLKD